MNEPCKTCGSEGFAPSICGPDRCEFCDGTFSGNPPPGAAQDGSTGPHPDVKSLKSYMLIIRAQTMKGPAVRQALDELQARGLWLYPEVLEKALEREKL